MLLKLDYAIVQSRILEIIFNVQDDKDAPKDEPAETSPTNAAQPSGSGCSTPAESKAKSEHSSDDENRNDSLPVKTENVCI